MSRLLPLLLLLLCACGGGAEAPEPLRVYAAASLREVFTELGAEFEARHGVPVRLSTGGSNLVANQVLAGALADVLVSASGLELVPLVEAQRVPAGGARELFGNALVVVVPRDAPAVETPVEELLLGARRLSLAHPEAVPAGRYARAWLQELGLWDELEARTLAGMDVRAALAAVASGGADVGIVYRTDARASEGVRVVHTVPAAGVRYVGAVLGDSERPELARLFLELCSGADGRAVLAAHGFTPLGD
ncbi:MAG: molybdate ABC transporter substrate-binding protein [Planctomycetota bacterium]|nr:molybdate ABC transporter substrate-binding protein [Planctomycetota bacterium]